jgi:hypothetical protein
MTTAAQYRQYAEECLTAMRASVIPEVRAALFTAAKRWTELADRTGHAEDEEPPSASASRRSTPGGTGASAQS